MSKFCLLFLFFVLTVSTARSAPLEEEEQERGDRHRRVTCDLLTYGGKIGHSACAANCLSMGKAGGRCNDGVCQCRITKLKDLWEDRFG